MRAERRCGELLRATERNKGATVKGGMAVERCDTHNATLAEMGLSRSESSRYQQLADMPDEHFETAVATAKATAGEVTTAFMLRAAKTVAKRNWLLAQRQTVTKFRLAMVWKPYTITTVEAKKSGRGGAREGGGRKPLKAGLQTVSVPIRMTTEQRDKLKRLGGPPWVRARIDKAREPGLQEDAASQGEKD